MKAMLFAWLLAVTNISMTDAQEWRYYTDTRSVYSILDEGDTIFAGTDGGVVCVNTRTGEVTNRFVAGESGLPSNEVRSLVRDLGGALWVGTYRNGLARVSGADFRVWDSLNSPLPGNNISALAVDSGGTVWAGLGQYSTSYQRYSHGGLARINTDLSIIVWDSLNSPMAHSDVRDLLVDREGWVWLTCTNGAARFDGNSVWLAHGSAEGLSHPAWQLALDSRGAVWADLYNPGGFNWNIAKYDSAPPWSEFSVPSMVLGAMPVDIAVDTNDDIWCMTSSRGLYLFDRDSSWDSIRNLPSQSLKTIVAAGDGAMLLGTSDRGVIRVADRTGEVLSTETSPLRDNSVGLILPYRGKTIIDTQVVDSAGLVWASLPPPPTGMARMTVLATGDNGDLWVAAYTGTGSAETGRLYRYGNDDAWHDENLLLSQYNGICVGRNDIPWVALDSSIATRAPGDTAWRYHNSGNSSLPAMEAVSIAQDGNGVIWIAFSDFFDGVVVEWSGTDTLRTHDLNLQTGRFFVDAQGYVWAILYRYLSRFDGASWRSFRDELPNQYVNALASDSAGNVWIGTDSGMAVFGTDGSWRVFTKANSGLPENNIHALAFRGNDLWVATNHSGLAVWGGVGHPIAVERSPGSASSGFSLEQNTPNPFNPATRIRYFIPRDGRVRLTVCDLLGRTVVTLFDGWQPAGARSVEFNAERLPAGIYLCRLRMGALSTTRRLVFAK